MHELWEREDTGFTKWLETNIDYLTDVVGFDITIESREKKVGPFSVDLYGEDENGDTVPAMNILINVMAIVSLVIAPLLGV